MADNPFHIKLMSPRELQIGGYLQEVNRLFFHPLGLAMGVTLNDDDPSKDSISVLDVREDPEGLYMAGDADDLTRKAALIRDIQDKRFPVRMEKLGYWVQPVGGGY